MQSGRSEPSTQCETGGEEVSDGRCTDDEDGTRPPCDLMEDEFDASFDMGDGGEEAQDRFGWEGDENGNGNDFAKKERNQCAETVEFVKMSNEEGRSDQVPELIVFCDSDVDIEVKLSTSE